MDVREKLVELVDKARRYAADKCHSFMSCAECSHYGENDGNCRNAYIAESLIAHGVTVQEWISVKDERKPKAGEDVLVVVFDGYDTYTDTDCLMRDGKWCYETENHKVTHWQPMPQPPKGE